MNEQSKLTDGLLPCPFCGAGETQFKENGKVWLGMKWSEPTSVSIQHWCTAETGQPNRMIERVGRDMQSAIAAWNQRAALAAQPVAPAEPVAWVLEFGAIDLPMGHPSRITGKQLFDDEATATAYGKSCGFNWRVLPVAAPPAAREGWRDHVEQRLRGWKFELRNGDRLGLEDFLDAESLEVLLDYVLDERAAPPEQP